MELSRHKGGGFQRAPAIKAILRQQLARLVRNVSENGNAFGQDRSVVQFQCRGVTLGVDGPKVSSVVGLFVPAHFDELVGHAHLDKSDVGSLTAATGCVVENHDSFLSAESGGLTSTEYVALSCSPKTHIFRTRSYECVHAARRRHRLPHSQRDP